MQHCRSSALQLTWARLQLNGYPVRIRSMGNANSRRTSCKSQNQPVYLSSASNEQKTERETMEISMTLPLSLNSIPRRAAVAASLSSCNSSFINNGSRSLLFLKKKKNNNNNSLVLNRNRTQKGCQCLFGLGIPELAVIAGVAALVFGPKKLPEVGRSIGKTVKSFQQAAKEFESELKKEPETASAPPPEEPKAVSDETKQDTNISSTSTSTSTENKSL